MLVIARISVETFRMKHLLALTAALALSAPAVAQDEPEGAPSPGEIVAEAPAAEWVTIAPENLLVMTLAPDAKGNSRQVVIQLMPAPFSQGWVDNIRTLARAKWYDGIAVVRVQDNYVVQWGDPNNDNPEATGPAKPLPEGLKVMGEDEYLVDSDAMSEASEIEVAFGTNDTTQAADIHPAMKNIEAVFQDRAATEADHAAAIAEFLKVAGLMPTGLPSEDEKLAMQSITPTATPTAPEGWHQRDSYSEWVEMWRGWPIANYEIGKWFNQEDEEVPTPMVPRHVAAGMGLFKDVEESKFWPVHCYGMVGVGRGYSPDTGTGAELYTVIGHAPRHLDRNIALVGRVVEGIEHLSSLPRGTGALGFYETAEERVPIESIRVASDLPEADQPGFEYLSTEGETFARYAEARANRRAPFFIQPAGGADICNIPVPVRRVSR